MTESPNAPGPWSRGNPRGGPRWEHERARRVAAEKELIKRATGRDPAHPVAGSRAWAEQRGLAVSISEQAAQLASVGQDEAVTGALQQAKAELERVLETAATIVGDLPMLTDILGPGEECRAAIDAAFERAAVVQGAIVGCADTIRRNG